MPDILVLRQDRRTVPEIPFKDFSSETEGLQIRYGTKNSNAYLCTKHFYEDETEWDCDYIYSRSCGAGEGNVLVIIGTNYGDEIHACMANPCGSYEPVRSDWDLIQISGLDGDDDIIGHIGKDVVYGGNDKDDILSYWKLDDPSANDMLYGNDGNDYIVGGGGDDYIDGGDGSDDLHGGEGDDTILGGEGNDTMSGGHGADELYGQSGNDVLMGSIQIESGSVPGEGADILNVGSGSANVICDRVTSDGTDEFTCDIGGGFAYYSDYNVVFGQGCIYGLPDPNMCNASYWY